MNFLDEVKTDLRLSNNKFDNHLMSLFDQCRFDLIISGVNKSVAFDGSHYLVNRAIIHYCHVNFPTGADVKQLEFHLRAYKSLRDTLALGKVGV